MNHLIKWGMLGPVVSSLVNFWSPHTKISTTSPPRPLIKHDDDDDDDILIGLPGLPNRGLLCGYKNGSSAAVASPSGIIYLMYNRLCSKSHLRLICLESPPNLKKPDLLLLVFSSSDAHVTLVVLHEGHECKHCLRALSSELFRRVRVNVAHVLDPNGFKAVSWRSSPIQSASSPSSASIQSSSHASNIAHSEKSARLTATMKSVIVGMVSEEAGFEQSLPRVKKGNELTRSLVDSHFAPLDKLNSVCSSIPSSDITARFLKIECASPDE